MRIKAAGRRERENEERIEKEILEELEFERSVEATEEVKSEMSAVYCEN